MSLVETGLVLRPELAGTLMTLEEFDAAEDVQEGHVYELIHGVLVVFPPPLEAERGPNETLGHWLLKYREEHPEGKAMDGTLPEHLVQTPDSRRRADRVIWAGLGRPPSPRKDPPSIIAEFLSAGKRSRQRDYIEKRNEYRALRVEEYWLIDRFRRLMTVYRADGSETVVREQDNYTTPLLPGFVLPLAQLLAVADLWETP